MRVAGLRERRPANEHNMRDTEVRHTRSDKSVHHVIGRATRAGDTSILRCCDHCGAIATTLSIVRCNRSSIDAAAAAAAL